jgi:flagellar basal-body rod protein FlgC
VSLNDAFNIASSGIQSAAFRVQAHTLNVANTATPYYKRKIPVVQEDNSMTFQGTLEAMRDGLGTVPSRINGNGVRVTGVAVDGTAGKRVYEPLHPQADKDGFVEMSNVNVINDIADSIVASRLYEANIAVITLVKQMGTRALEIGRGQ